MYSVAMQKQLEDIARNVLKNNIYLTLATIGDYPWAAPVYYCLDNSYNFYFISQLQSVHIQHIFHNNRVAFAIFDSQQKEGTGNGVQGSGRVYQIDEKDLSQALQWYHTDFVSSTLESFIYPAPYRLFKLIPEHFYILDPKAEIDRRIEVFLRK